MERLPEVIPLGFAETCGWTVPEGESGMGGHKVRDKAQDRTFVSFPPTPRNPNFLPTKPQAQPTEIGQGLAPAPWHCQNGTSSHACTQQGLLSAPRAQMWLILWWGWGWRRVGQSL